MNEIKFNTIEEFETELSKSWVPVTSNRTITDGGHLVTLMNQLNHRRVAYALYNKIDGWTVIDNDDDDYIAPWKVIAFLPNINCFITPYDKPVMRFNKGDIIVWTDPVAKDKVNWMLIDRFDHQADIAARAAIGKVWYSFDNPTIYSDFAPGRFGDDCHLATDEEKKVIYEEMLSYFRDNDSIERKIEMMRLMLANHQHILTILEQMF